jgi:hypothetical protein
MNCEKCGKEMGFQYDVEERNVLFVLWDCDCGYKYLERRPQTKAAAINGPAIPSILAGKSR